MGVVCRRGLKLTYFYNSKLDEGQHVTSFWTELYDVGINHKTLLSVLFVILERKKSVSN